jgi:hypothetical protein
MDILNGDLEEITITYDNYTEHNPSGKKLQYKGQKPKDGEIRINKDGERDAGEEINGFWAGKFELTGSQSEPTTLPNEDPIRNQNVAGFFQIARQFNYGIGTTNYGLTSEYDAHMMKNTEWGAVAYLSHSKYGINGEISINSSTSYYTGGGSSNAYVTNASQAPPEIYMEYMI